MKVSLAPSTLLHFLIQSTYALAVVNMFLKEQKGSHENSYLLHVSVEQKKNHRPIFIILAMTAFHAEMIHKAKCLLVDFTYKCTHGDWKEFEVVCWDGEHRKSKW